MTFETVMNSRLAIRLVLRLAQRFSPGNGYRVAETLGGWMGSLKWLSQVHGVRANQWVIGAERMDAQQLDHRTLSVYRNMARSLYDFYHNLNRPNAILEATYFDPSFEYYLRKNQEGKQGILLVGAHQSAFDVVGRAMGLRGMRLQVLSYPNPTAGLRLQNQLRRVKNMVITPLSIEAMRQAGRFLQEGGAVITLVDRPVADRKYQPRFFGRPAALPVGHVRLALKAGLPVVVMTWRRRPDGVSIVSASDPIEMRPNKDLRAEIVENAERILAVIEASIRSVPEQWSMFYPVWPEVLPQVPE